MKQQERAEQLALALAGNPWLDSRVRAAVQGLLNEWAAQDDRPLPVPDNPLPPGKVPHT